MEYTILQVQNLRSEQTRPAAMTMAFGGDSPGCPAINGSLEAGSGVPVAATCAGAKDTFSRPPTDLRGNPGAFGNRCSGVMTAQPWAACNMPIVRGRGKYDEIDLFTYFILKLHRTVLYVSQIQLCRCGFLFYEEKYYEYNYNRPDGRSRYHG